MTCGAFGLGVRTCSYCIGIVYCCVEGYVRYCVRVLVGTNRLYCCSYRVCNRGPKGAFVAATGSVRGM